GAGGAGARARGGRGRAGPAADPPAEAADARPAGQVEDRHVLVRRPHEAAPYFHRQAAAGRLAGRRGIVVAEPYAGDEMAGIADEPGGAEILAGAGLAGARPRPHPGPAP